MRREALVHYLAKSGVKGPWTIDGGGSGPFPGGIVIPVLEEAAVIPQLLDSLCGDPSLPQSGLLVLFVVNNREDAAAATVADNARTLTLLRSVAGTLPFPVATIDASSAGLALPLRHGGVGLARKIGHDLLLPHLGGDRGEPVLVSLDADTLVSPGYAAAIVDHFRAATAGGAVIPFVHRRAEDAETGRAIERYELFLRCYVAGLAYAGSPYAFQTVGSAMACTASAYLRCGGMNRRLAGEDFYFLQSLAKCSGIGQVKGATVYPSPRRSQRVPFGTGRAVGALLDGERQAVLFHRPAAFRLLQEWLEAVAHACRERCADLPLQAGRISPHLEAFLHRQEFPRAWEGLLQHNGSGERLLAAFHCWFDAFRTMKLFHFLAAGPWPRAEPDDVLGDFPEAWGAGDLTPSARLALLRRRQNGGAVDAAVTAPW